MRGERPVSGAPPPVFHPVEGRADCASCHRAQRADARAMPSSHAELPSASCLACHPRAQGTLPGLYGGFAVGAVLCALAVLSLRLPKLPRSVKLRGLLLDGLWACRIFDHP